jgi:DNA repair protein RadC
MTTKTQTPTKTPYNIPDITQLMSHEHHSDTLFPVTPKKYVLKIRDLPELDKPREKMIQQGPTALSTAELLAVILNTGTKSEGVLEMSERIIKEYGERALINHKDVQAMADDLNIPLVRAAQIVAVGELGKRFFQKKGGTTMVRSAKDAYEYLSDMQHLDKEHLRGLYLNNHYRIIHDEVISIGTVDANLIHPREVFKPALEYGAVAVILAHNHPSGIIKPSLADQEVTRQIIEAGRIMGITLLDHVIIGKGKFASIEMPYDL